MKKYIDVSNEIKDKFKTGIQILDDVSNDIQELLTLLQNSSGDTIELIKSDLTFLKDKYTTIKEKVEKRSSEIEERANNYDACLEKYIEQKGKKTRDFDEKKDAFGCVYEYKTETLNEVLGPDDSSDGIGCCNYLIKIYTMGDMGAIYSGSYSTDYKKIDEMANFQGGFWNASDYVMNSIALGVSQLSKVAPSTSNNSGTGNVNYTSALWGKIVSENDKPAEPLPPEHGVEAIAMLEDVNSKEKYMSRNDAERKLKKEGYTPDEVQYALENVKVNWKERAAEYAQHYYDQNGEAVSYYGSVEIFLEKKGFTEEEIQYAVEHINRY